MSKKGPTLKILYSCGDYLFHKRTINFPIEYSFDKCDKLEKRLTVINTPDTNCPFKIKNAEEFHNVQLEILKKEEEYNLKNCIQNLFPNHWNMWYRDDIISFCKEGLCQSDISSINDYFPNWGWSVNSNDNGELMITLQKVQSK